MPTGTATPRLPGPGIASATKLKVTGELVHYGLNVAPPLITPASGDYPTEVEVTMSCATPEAVIHYRLDGVTPTEADPIYTTPITLVL